MKNFWGPGVQTLLFSARPNDTVRDTAPILPRDSFLKRHWALTKPAGAILAMFLCFLTVSAMAQPANDNFTNAIVITGALGSTNGSNIGATLQAGETNQVIITSPNNPIPNQPVGVGSSVWFQWTGATNGKATFTTIGSTDQFGNVMSTVLAVWTGNSISNLTLVASCASTYYSSLGLSSPNSSVTFPALAGTNYYISVDLNVANGGQQGNYVLNWNAQTPANDDFTNAINLGNALGGTTSGVTLNATIESNEPAIINTSDNGSVAVGNSIWYQWKALQNGNVTFDTFGSTDELGNPQDTVLGVWQGNNVTNLVFVQGDDNLGTNLNSSVTFFASAGQTYDIAVYVNQQNAGLPGDVVLDWLVETTNTPASGTFQFTSPQYQYSQNEEDGADHSLMTAYPAPRVTITRIGGADGMADVGYYFTNTIYTNWTTTVIYATNAVSYFYGTNSAGNPVLQYYTNGITALYNITQVYENYNTTYGFFNMTNLSASLLEQSYSNGQLTSSFFTNGLPYVTNLAILQATNITFYTNSNVNPTTGLGSITNEFWITNDAPQPTQTNTSPTYLVVESTNFLTYTNITVTNFVSSYLGTIPLPLGPQVAVFNDYQMNYDLPVEFANDIITPNAANPLVLVVMSGAALDPYEDPILPAPQVSPTRNIAYVSLASDFGVNPSPAGQGYPTIYGDIALTNNVFNFERSTLRCDKTVVLSGNAYIGVTCNNYNGQNTASVYYRIDYFSPGGNDANNQFTTQAGSDYARPDDPGRGIYTAASDFTGSVVQTLSPSPLTWSGPGDVGVTKYIEIPITQDSTVKFNKDIRIEFYYPSGSTPQSLDGYIGNINTCTLTILMTTPPAGAVDTEYMAENNGIGNDPFDPDPGADNGQVNAVVVQTNGYAVIGGEFSGYDAQSGGGVGYIARLDTTGALDPAFDTQQGFGGGFIKESPSVWGLALDTNQNILAVGQFTSYQNKTASGIARLLPTGDLDPSFNSGGAGANSNVWTVVAEANGQILIGGDFTKYNGTNCNHIARLNPDGSLDTTFNPGIGPNGTIHAIAVQTNGAIVIGGTFTEVDTTNFNNIARLNADGSLDNTFSNLDGGASGTVYALAVQTNDLILVGGDFASIGPDPTLGYLARLNPDGSVDPTFQSGSGPNNTVECIDLQNDGTFYIGGYFTFYNQTRRVGLARILPNGWLDTSFMDTAYNQFAGIVNNYYSNDPFYDNGADQPNGVLSIAVEPVQPPLDESQTNDIIIGGSFYQVGGDGGLPEAQFTQTFNREAPPHPRSNVARLIGGSTPGPGNVTFTDSSYSANNGSGAKFIQVARENGRLGTASIFFQPIQEGTGPGYAAQGVDYSFNPTLYSDPAFGVSWGTTGPGTWMLEDGMIGVINDSTAINGSFTEVENPVINIISNAYVGSVSLNLQLASPRDQGVFFLGGNADLQASVTGFGNPATAQGEDIPLGVALGSAAAPLTITHSSGSSGQFSFTQSYYYTNENDAFAMLTVTRAGGSSGTVHVKYTTAGGTAVAGRDYYSTNGTLTFADANPQYIFVQLINYFTNQPDRVFGVSIYNADNGGTLGPITNSDVEIVNDNISSGFAEFVNGTPATTNVMGYGVNENGGVAQVSVARLGGSSGVLQVTLSTANGTATAGNNYESVSTNLIWNSGNNGSPVVQTVNIPIVDSGTQSSNLTFKVNLSNAILGNQAYTNFSAYSNAVVTITNSDLPGTVEFTAPSYTVNENGGSAIIPIVRTGGSAGNLSVQFYTMNGTAASGVNFQGTTNTIVFAPGQVNANVVIAISNQFSPTSLNFSIGLTNTSPANALGSPNLAQVTINGADSINQPPGQPDPTYNPSFNASVLALALQTNGELLAGGEFTLANNVQRNYIARLETNGVLDPTFSSYLSTSGADAPVESITVENSGLILVGGIFTNFNNETAYYVTRLNVNGTTDTGFNPGFGANNPVYATAQTFVGGQSRLLLGGSFTQFNGNQENGIVQLYESGGVDPDFNASANATIWAIAVQPNGQILIGGDFTNVDGMAVNHIARLNADGSLDYGFMNAISNPLGGANDSVRAIALQLDGRVLIGGNFTNVDGVPCNYIARLNSDGTLDTSFINAYTNSAMGASAPVNTISVQSDSRILVGGQFTEFNGVTRNYVTRLNADGTTDLTMNFGTGADGLVAASVIQNDGNIVLGGAFTNFDNALHECIVRLWGRSIVGSGSFGFSVAGETVSENGIFAPVTIIRNGGTAGTNADGSGDVYVNLITLTNSGTAVPGVNYMPTNALVDFPPGEVEQTVNIPVINDVVPTPSQWTASFLLTNPIPSSLTINALQNTNTLTILNSSSFISFSSPVYSVIKDVPGGMANINLVLQGYTNTTSTVVFSTTTGGTAVPGVEYTSVPPTTVTFEPGVTDVVVQVPIIDDPSYTGNQTVTMALTNASNPYATAYLVAPTNATLTIEDLGNTPGQIAFASSNINVNISSGYAIVPVVYTNGDKPTTVHYTTHDGTAVAGVNYDSTSGTLSFGNGIESSNIVVKLPQYTTPEGPVAFTITLDTPTDGAALISPTNAIVTISDDISTGVSFLNATNYVQETNGVVSVPVQRLGNTSNTFSLSFFTTNGTAVANTNYVPISSSLTFFSGDALANIKVTLINNENVSNLTFGISLLPPTNSAIELMSPSNALVVETPAAAGICFTSTTNSVPKSTNFVTIPVICLDPSNEPPILNSNSVPLTVEYATADGTAQAGSDYYQTNGVLVFTNGIVTNTIQVQIINNNLITGSRTFSVNLFNPSPVPPGKLVAPTNQVVTIIDSNSGLEFSSANYSIDSGGVATITVLRVDNPSNLCSVAFATTPGGSAVPGSDYYPTNGVLTFQPGQTSNSFGVTIIGSSAIEPDKTILLALSNPTNGILTAPSAATLTIYNQNGSYIVPAGVSLASPTNTPTGVLQSNQLALLNFGFRDAGGLNVSSMSATLLKSANIVPTSSPETASYGALTVNGHSVSQQFSLTPIGTNGQTVMANFQLQVTSVGSSTPVYETNSFALTIGSWTTTWSNTNAIVIAGETNTGSAMLASPYPSIITVTNVGGVIVGVTTTVTNFSDGSPPAVEMLLVSPSLSDTMLMAGAGSNQTAVTSLTLTFSNCVPPIYLPSGKGSPRMTNGVYNPTQDGGITPFP